MDAMIAVEVSRVVLSCLFGQMAVCVLITDWVLDTVNTIKEETSFICSASPTHRHTHTKRDVHTDTKHQRIQCANVAKRHKLKDTKAHSYISKNRTWQPLINTLNKNAQCKWIVVLIPRGQDCTCMRLCNFPSETVSCSSYKSSHQ